jgi:hypothetical protein
VNIPEINQVMKETCEFVRYSDHTLWYAIHYFVPAGTEVSNGYAVVGEVFEFPVPVDDAGAGNFERDMKAINLMRWIRKHIEFLTDARKAEGLT